MAHDRQGTVGAFDCQTALVIARDALDQDMANLEDTIADLERAGDEPRELARQREMLEATEAAAQTLTAILEQQGCEHFGANCPDGMLTTLMDVAIFG